MVEAVGLQYRTFDIAGANYIWTVPPDAEITSGQGTHEITVDWGCTPGNISLELQTACDTATLSYDVPSFALPTLSGPGAVTGNQAGITYSLSQASSGSLTWEVPNGASIVSGQGTYQIVVDWGCEYGDVIVTYAGFCGSSFSDTLSVAIQTYTISGQPSIPPNTTSSTYSIGEVPNATYIWSVPSDVRIISGQGTPTIEVDFGTMDGVISVIVETTCGTNSYDFPFAVEASILYADFDVVDLEFIPYEGVVFEEVDNPSPSGINTSNRVGRVNKTFGSAPFAGIEADVYEIAFDLRPVMSQKVFSSETGVVRFMLDDETTGMERIKIELDYGPNDVNQWVQLVYDFTGIPSEVYDQLRLTYNHGSTTTEFWYFDDVMGHTEAILSTSSVESIIKTIKVYPNPSSDLFFVDTKDIFPVGSKYDLEILDTRGRLVLRQQDIAQGQPVAFDIGAQPTGVYFLHLNGQSLHYVKAIVKKD